MDGFWIDQMEMSNAHFSLFTESTGYQTDAERKGDSLVYDLVTEWGTMEGFSWRYPKGAGSYYIASFHVRHVSWNVTSVYCAWLGRRLPTEAEWEKAARGENGFLFPWGNQLRTDESVNANLFNHEKVEGGSYEVGLSPYGIFDLSGNVWEWVSDFYAKDYYRHAPDTNPSGPNTGEGHVLRGGSWATEFETELTYLMTTFRFMNFNHFRSDVLGFRCSMDAEKPE